MGAQIYSVPDQTKERRKTFFEWKNIALSYKLSLICGSNDDYFKIVCHPIPTRKNKEHLDNFKNKSVSSTFN